MGKGHSIDKNAVPSGSFRTGFDRSVPAAWSGWSKSPGTRMINPYEGYQKNDYQPKLNALDVKGFTLEPEDDSGRAMSKAGELLTAVGGRVRLAERTADLDPADTLSSMGVQVERLFDNGNEIYTDIDTMFREVDVMYAALDGNYKSVGNAEITQDVSSKFNNASDVMAARAALMARTVEGMKSAAANTVQDLDGFLAALDHKSKDGRAKVQSLDELSSGLDQSAKIYSQLTDAVRKSGMETAGPSDEGLQFLTGQKSYLKSLKSHIQTSELQQVEDVRKYVQGARSYIEKVTKDFDATQNKLGDIEAYFQKAKISVPAGGSHEIEAMPADGNVCAGAEKPGLKPLQECSKSCRTVCRWKEKVGGSDCYECPSGSPDSCYDVKAWPANHPWCQPGGVCHSDPMMYCAPFGATGPNLEKLECTSCKQRPDMCAQKVGGGMTLTNCKLGCWNGKCVYKGKYEEFEWDGKSEYVHCFECKTPPAPPTCEDMGWGYGWENSCNKNCPQPGKCEEVTMPGGKKKGAQPPAGGDPNKGQNGENGPTDGPSEGETKTGGTPATSGEDGSKPTPPTGSPEQPGGGAGAIASGPGSDAAPDAATGGKPATQEAPKKPEGQPDTTHVDAPTAPEGQKPDIKDTEPPEPPDNAQTTWLRKWIAEDDAIIDDRNAIIADPDEGDETKAEAARQVESYTKERERLNNWLNEEQDRERARLNKEAEDKARVEAGNAERERTRTRWPDPKKVMQDIKLRELNESLERMKTRLKELQEALQGRREHIDRLDREIELLKREIQHHKDSSESGSEDSTQAKNTIAELEKQLAHKVSLRNQLADKLNAAQRAANEEFTALKKDYQKKLYATDENLRRREDATRIDQYYDKYIELEQTMAGRDERNRQFEEKFKDMETQIAEAKARGDTDTAEKLEEQLENMKRGKTDWDKQYETRIKNIEEQIYQMGNHDNFEMGVGPSNKEDLVRKVNEYAKIVDDQIGATEKRITELEQAWKENKIGTSVRADGSEHVVELDNLRERLNQLRDSRAALQEKQDVLKNGYKLPDDIKENMQANTDRYAEGSKNVGEDKSFARLALESLGEEMVHNMNPLVAAKKSVAFAWGVAKGVGTAVKDLAVLGVGLADLSYELQMQALGFEGGGIFGTDSTEKLYAVLDTVYNNANFDGVIKAVVAAGGALDAEIKKLEKSGDIDWAAAELGGNVAGQTIVGDVVIEAAVGKAVSLLGFADEAAGVANAAKKTENLLDDAADVGRTTGKAADELPSSAAIPDSTGPPKNAPHDTPPTRGPPAPGVYDNTKPLPSNNRSTTQLSENVLDDIEKNQGFRKDHAQRMSEFAQETDSYLIVRDGNPDSVKYFDDPDMMSKPMSSKAKTAKVGPDQGLVVDPTNAQQAGYWDDAIAEAKKAGDAEQVAWLEKNREKALETWEHYGDEMLDSYKKTGTGYRVNPDTGVIEYVEKLPDGTEKVTKGIHGDYDLHGVYKKNPDGTMESVSFGEGQHFDDNGIDTSGSALRQQLNTKLTGGTKDMVNHGGQDDWIPDPNKVPNKPPDPPVTVFGPNGGPPVHLKTAQEMKDFYENVMGVKWPYPEPLKTPVAAAAAADAAKPASAVGSTTQKFDNVLETPKAAESTLPPNYGASKNLDDIPTINDRSARVTSPDDVTVGNTAGGTIAPPQGGAGLPQAPPLKADASTWFTAPDGTKVQVNTGDRLGSGLTSSAYKSADNAKEVIRVTDMGGEVPQAVKLDQAGRSAVEDIQKNLGDNSPIRVVEQHKRYEVNDPTSPLHNKVVEVVELAEQGTAKNVLADTGGVMSDAQARAFDQATRALNDKGYAWLDSHSGNYTFEQIPGGGPDDVRILIIDPGGIVPMKGATAAEKAANARAIQSRINAPEESFNGLMKSIDKADDRIKAGALAEERGFILEAHGQNIDMKAMGLPDDPNLVAFNPGGALKHGKVQELFGKTAEEAAKYGK